MEIVTSLCCRVIKCYVCRRYLAEYCRYVVKHLTIDQSINQSINHCHVEKIKARFQLLLSVVLHSTGESLAHTETSAMLLKGF